ncbi:MAG: glycosyltransferase [Rhizobiales bacterium]|nr:glycosyltransferase [Hyphomicrobiales bacterium]
MAMSRKFSVLLPTRDRLELAKGAIETVRRQPYKNWELVLSDNCSRENVAEYVQLLNDPRIQYIRSDTPLHVTENWNRAIEAATGDYVVMLGDDDGLIHGYFDRLNEVLDQLEQPDFVFTGAFNFTFPGVIADCPDGKIEDVSIYQSFFVGRDNPSLLPKVEAHAAARAALDMQAVYGFNMQYFLFSRPFLERMREYGPVFQGPFPDFYAANLAMLIADRIGLLPEPVVFIGISPKSYGFFHFNEQEKGGMAFLNAERSMEPSDAIRDSLLPGTNMNTSWLISVDQVRAVLGDRMNLAVGVDRYRLLQLFYIIEREGTPNAVDTTIADLWSKLAWREKTAVLAFRFTQLLKYLPYRQLYKLAHKRVVKALAQYPRKKGRVPLQVQGQFRSMTDVYDALRL